MTKIIVTHYHPDLDAYVSIWLIRRFLSGWEEAEVNYVAQGETFRGIEPDIDPEVLHVDTGLGKLDHHQTRKNTCASELCLKKIIQQRDLKKLDKAALKRLVAVVNDVDHGRDIGWSEANDDRYELMLHNILHAAAQENGMFETYLRLLDRVHQIFKNKIQAEKLIKEKGLLFASPWGESVGVETGNDQIVYVGERIGYSLVVKQDPKTKHARIYGRFDRGVDLRGVYRELKKTDKEATWYLHPSRCLLLNQSRTRPGMKATKYSLPELIEILKRG